MVLAVSITAFYRLIFQTQGPWNNLFLFFTIIFLGVWAASFWFNGIGPVLWEISWLPLLMFSFILGLILTIFTPVKAQKRSTRNFWSYFEPDEPAGAAIAVFWLITILLVFSIILGYLS
jgi:hypothetical protein